MKKLFLTCAAVVGISAVFAANVFAADPIVNDAGFSKTEGTYSVKSDLSAYTGQMTILIIPEDVYNNNTTINDSDIYYIDQAAAPASGSKIFQSVGILGGTTLKEGTSYIVKIGGENIAESGIIVEKFTVAKTATGTEYKVGDVDGNGSITIGDVTTLIDKVLNKITYFTTTSNDVLPYLVGDVDGNGSITIGDVTTAIDRVLNKITDFTNPTYTLPAGTTPESTYTTN